MPHLPAAERDGVPQRDEDTPSGAHQSRRRSRVWVGYLVVAAILPYLLLKAAWIAGSTIGFATESSVDSHVLLGGNTATAGMELVAIVVVLAFTCDWGLRLPAWSVLLPAWAGTGLLAPFVIAGPLVVVSVATQASPVGDGSFEPWVGPVVYSGFGAQAVGIALTFALYARARDGDFDALVTVLDPDVVLRSDGGRGPARLTTVITGARDVARQAITFGRLSPFAAPR